jgi:hypothetical protein
MTNQSHGAKTMNITKNGSFPNFRNQENAKSLRKIWALIDAQGPQSFHALARLVDDHVHGSEGKHGGDSFVRYCIRNSWLREI